MKLRKLFPLIGIGVIGVAGISTGVSLALTSKNVINDTNINAVYNSKLLSYAFNNLTSYDILNNPVMLSDYLYDYGVFGDISENPYKSVKVDTQINSDGNYDINKIEFVSSKDDSIINVDCDLNTNVVETTSIDDLDFSNLYNLFMSFNTISEVYEQCFTSTNSLLNLLINNIKNLKSEYINSLSINFSNDYNNTNVDTLAFNLTIILNDEYTYKGSNVIFEKLESSILIDWKRACDNANSYFNINSQGVITGITDLGLEQPFLVVPMEFYDENYNLNSITGIESLLPNDSNSLDTSNVKAIVLPNNIKTIGNNAFGTSNNYNSKNSYENLTWINLPKSLQSIGNEAFASCFKLQSLDFASLNYLLTIGNYAFNNCDAFNYIIMSNSINNLGYGAFNNVSNFRILKLSRSLTQIPNVAFGSSTNLKGVEIPYGITSIGNQAFAYSGLKTINIPYSITSVGTNAFTNVTCKNIVFLDRKDDKGEPIENPIQFGSYMFGDGVNNPNLNIYIFGKYTDGGRFWLTFHYYTVNVNVNYMETYKSIIGGGNNMNTNYLFLMDNSNLPYPTINNVDQFVQYVQENVKSFEDINNIYKNSNYVYDLANKFSMLYNNNWISSFKLNGKTNNNYINDLIFTIIFRNGLTYDIDVPLLEPIIYPSQLFLDGHIFFDDNFLNDMFEILNRNFSQYYINNSSNFLNNFAPNSYNSIISELNSLLDKYGYNALNLQVNFLSYRNYNDNNDVQIGIKFNSNNITISNNNNFSISTYNSDTYLVSPFLTTNIHN